MQIISTVKTIYEPFFWCYHKVPLGRSGRGNPNPYDYRHYMTVIKSFEPAAEPTELESSISSIKGPLIVIIRHGKTEHNKLGLFTGWEDAPLAAEGRGEALYCHSFDYHPMCIIWNDVANDFPPSCCII